jgi:broad specificity phosphatase PhoE
MGVVLLVRHGQASFGADDYDVLSETGIEQSRVLGRALAAQGVAPSAVVHGTMRRQGDTASLLVDAAGWDVVPEPDEGWDEFDHLSVVARGVTVGQDVADWQVFDAATARWSGGQYDDEYDEAWPTFVRRTGEALERAVAREGVTVAVTSGGVIGALCAGLVDQASPAHEAARLWRSFNTVTTNASVTRVVTGPTGRRLLTFNEHSHLPRELVTYR